MGEVKEYTFEELCQIVGAIAAEYGILKVYLFGSRARGDNRPDSDTEIDIVSERAMRDDFSREVLRDRRLLYEA